MPATAYLDKLNAEQRLAVEHGVDGGIARAAAPRTLELTVLAAGVETESEFLILKDSGIKLFQGYRFARPEFERLPQLAHSGRTAQL